MYKIQGALLKLCFNSHLGTSVALTPSPGRRPSPLQLPLRLSPGPVWGSEPSPWVLGGGFLLVRSEPNIIVVSKPPLSCWEGWCSLFSFNVSLINMLLLFVFGSALSGPLSVFSMFYVANKLCPVSVQCTLLTLCITEHMLETGSAFVMQSCSMCISPKCQPINRGWC